MAVNTTAEKEVVDTLERLTDAVANRDFEASLALFARDPDTILIGSNAGEINRGPQEIEAFYRRLYGGLITYSWEWGEPTVHVRDDLAWIVASGEAILEENEQESRAPYRMSAVLERRDGEWKFLLFHGSELAD